MIKYIYKSVIEAQKPIRFLTSTVTQRYLSLSIKLSPSNQHRRKKAIPSGAPASITIRSQETTIRKAGYPPISFLRYRFSSQVSSSFIETAMFYQFYLLTRQPGAPIPRKQFHSIQLAIKNTWTITEGNSFRN